MKVKVYNELGDRESDLSISEKNVVDFDGRIVSQYVIYINAEKRNSIANVKDRGKVSGGGVKPWKQKGTGKARVGSNRSPLWVGGGVTHGPSSEIAHKLRINSKFKRLAQRMILSYFVKSGKAIVLKHERSIKKTKDAYALLLKLGCAGKSVVIKSSDDGDEFERVFRNISGVDVMSDVNIRYTKIINCNHLLLSKKAAENILMEKES